ncbi:hypothetical protein IR117_11360, partial [Streptococcus danieliae]|nr:hypothetical protein [Streptococcus danieliae]
KYKDEDIKNIDEILPKFSKLDKIGIFKGDKRIDSENSRLYSTICFDCLGMGRIENFSNGEITGNEDDKELKGKRRAKRIQNLILSMNEEYRLAYMLYQLL